MRPAVVLLLAVSMVTVGCLGVGEPEEVEPATDADPVGADDGIATPRFHAPVNVSEERPGAEPMLGVAPDGTIFVTGTGPGQPVTPDGSPLSIHRPTQTIWRSTDGGQSWEEVTPQIPPTAHTGGVDNALAVGPDGTVYYLNAAGATQHMFRTTDGGDTWDPLALPPFPTPMHRSWIAPGEDGRVHVASESLATLNNWHLGSEERGSTWGPPTPIHEDPGFGSDLAIGPDGTLYLARTSLASATPAKEDTWDLLVSTDGGTTWDRRTMFPHAAELTGSWQSLEVGPDGTLHMVWAQMHDGTSLVHHAFSLDGETWSTPAPIAPTNGTQTLPWMDVRGPGELGIVWYAADQAGPPNEVDAKWYVDYALVTDADTDDPTVQTTRVTPWPVHEGAICTDGPFCRSDRSLLDFTWVAFGPEGRAHLAFASTMWDQASAFPVVAVEAPVR